MALEKKMLRLKNENIENIKLTNLCNKVVAGDIFDSDSRVYLSNLGYSNYF